MGWSDDGPTPENHVPISNEEWARRHPGYSAGPETPVPSGRPYSDVPVPSGTGWGDSPKTPPLIGPDATEAEMNDALTDPAPRPGEIEEMLKMLRVSRNKSFVEQGISRKKLKRVAAVLEYLVNRERVLDDSYSTALERLNLARNFIQQEDWDRYDAAWKDQRKIIRERLRAEREKKS